MSKKPYVSAICKVFSFLGDVFERIKKQVARTEIVTCPITARSFPDWGYAGSRLEWYAGRNFPAAVSFGNPAS